MMPSTTATARSSAPSSPLKKSYKSYKGSYTKGPLPPLPVAENASPWQRGPTQNHKRQYKRYNKKVPKNGKPPHQSYPKRQNNDCPTHGVLLHRLSQPASPPSGTLLERIGGSVEDEPASMLSNSDGIDGERVSEGSDISSSNSPFSATPHFYTPEPGEVERFLESVIGAPPAPPTPSGSVHACSGSKPSLALETHNLSGVDHCLVKVEDTSGSVLSSPTQTAVNSSANLSPFGHCQQRPKILGDTMPPPSASTIEECRRHLIPVLASARARDPGKRLDSEQCPRLLSDDHCSHFMRKAKEMVLQLAYLLSQKTPVNQGWSGALKRDRADEVDDWVRTTRSRFNSVNTVVSNLSRRDSDITLVDVAGGSLPKAPRAMRQASRASQLNNAQHAAPYQALVGSPTSEEPANTASLIELIRQAIMMFPTLAPTSQLAPEILTANVSIGQPIPDQPPEHPVQELAPTQSAPSSSVDFVSHLPTQAGIWFKQQGRRFAEIVDVDIEVSDEMFYLSGERQSCRLRMHLRLCSVPVGDSGNATLQDIGGAIERHALQWPKKGKLVVQVNPETERSKTWLPHALASDPLDVTSCVRPGKNIFRFIQLSDLSGFAFVLVGSPPPPEEAWRSWDWASLAGPRERSLSSSSPSTGDPANGLAEFAHIPVTIRS